MAWIATLPSVSVGIADVDDHNDLIGNVNLIGAAWTAYTPQIDQGATTNIAKTVTYAKYVAAGKWVRCNVKLAVTAAGTASNAILVSLPFTAATASDLTVGSGDIADTSAGAIYAGSAKLQSTTRVGIRYPGAFTAYVGATSSGMTAALASGDLISFSIDYEAA